VSASLSKIEICFFFVCLILSIIVVPVAASDYSVGVVLSDYVKYGNYSGNSTYALLSDVNWTKYEVTAISGTNVTMMHTGALKNGTILPGSGNADVYDIERYTINGINSPGVLIAIIPANLTQGDPVPGAGVNVTTSENRTYLGIERTINIVEYNSTMGNTTYVAKLAYDGVSGVLLEALMGQIDSSGTAIMSCSIIETNIFTDEVIPDLPPNLFMVLIIMALSTSSLFLRKKMLKKQSLALKRL
jgi:hypothetical protein